VLEQLPCARGGKGSQGSSVLRYRGRKKEAKPFHLEESMLNEDVEHL